MEESSSTNHVGAQNWQKPLGNQIYLVTFTNTQLTQASFLQKIGFLKLII